MAVTCAVTQRDNLHRSVDERTSQSAFFAISAVLFVTSAAVTIHCCTSMSMAEMPMPDGWTMSTMWLRMCGQTWLDAAMSFVAMWLAMMVTMMLPSLTPVLWRYYWAVGQVDASSKRFNSLSLRERAGARVLMMQWWRCYCRVLCRIKRIDSVQRAESEVPVTERSRSVLGFSALCASRVNVTHAGDPSRNPYAVQSVLIASLGYFFLWTLIGIAVFAIGTALMTMAIHLPTLANVVPLVSGVIILMAGALQFTSWKAERLACCREVSRCHRLPASIDDAQLSSRLIAAWRYGLHLGYHCSACCAGLTVTLLVIGVMDLRAMAVVTVAINAERLAPTNSVARIIGVFIVAAGVLMITQSIIR